MKHYIIIKLKECYQGLHNGFLSSIHNGGEGEGAYGSW